ncbi:hypothetical protein GGTG_14030 [Gaeumannomyces tritici R3-111a-1]|uniref:Uncharacterized protein n=1 Tax=Gaeumannomyces tritici (strain R3-111a-1) TaxID=644352 RepID=J3PKH4_GAET3|nr:hypothetical protein GGTG_14030 [Gaeumannomyces tritici R3-111a-1]EJT68392.1 hypothetical protein GGTG_14030 [Gaeumannomyces tritici R3-111a-1]
MARGMEERKGGAIRAGGAGRRLRSVDGMVPESWLHTITDISVYIQIFPSAAAIRRK